MRWIPTCAAAMAAALLLTGCGRPQIRPVDRDVARQALETTLETWKKGEKPETLRDGSPAITVQDLDWQSGAALVDYSIVGAERTDDANMHRAVKLVLRNARGETVEKEVTYVIGTHPVITVFREMAM